MNLIKLEWNSNDIISFNKYLYSLKNTEEKITWTKKIINTNKEILAIPSPKLKEIAKEISKGNYLSFLNYNLDDYHENTIINAYLINRIKDYNTQKSYLLKYLKNVDNWASVDSLKLNIKHEENNYLKLAKELIMHKKTFYRRCGIIILFNLIQDDYLDDIFNIISSLINEEEYYVNMAISWLLCELVIKKGDRAIDYLKNNKINKFVLNKTISKCNDSFRISNEDKKKLKKIRDFVA